jgi:hypothetical protein
VKSERRKHQRHVRPFEGTYSGASTRCRIVDISVGGCFVQSIGGPNPGEPTVVTVFIGHHQLVFSGKVVYVDHGMGFAVQFTDVAQTELDELARLLAALETKASA